jgi:hypothetical protein
VLTIGCDKTTMAAATVNIPAIALSDSLFQDRGRHHGSRGDRRRQMEKIIPVIEYQGWC